MLDTQGLEGKGYQPVTVPTRARWYRGQWALTTVGCPFCPKKPGHYHGGGNGDAPSYGERLSHCGTELGGMYVLVPAGGAA